MILPQEKNGDDRIHNTLYQTTEGIFNLKENLLYGETTQKITNDIKNIKDRHKDNKYTEEEKYSTRFMYKDRKGYGSDSSLDVSHVKLIFNRLQGVGNLQLKVEGDKKNFNEPNTVGFTLTESQFQEIINDKLNLQYDSFEKASIAFNFNDSKDTKQHPMQIIQLTILIVYETKNSEGKLLTHTQQISVNFSSKKDNDQEAKQDYVKYEKYFQNNK